MSKGIENMRGNTLFHKEKDEGKKNDNKVTAINSHQTQGKLIKTKLPRKKREIPIRRDRRKLKQNTNTKVVEFNNLSMQKATEGNTIGNRKRIIPFNSSVEQDEFSTQDNAVSEVEEYYKNPIKNLDHRRVEKNTQIRKPYELTNRRLISFGRENTINERTLEQDEETRQAHRISKNNLQKQNNKSIKVKKLIGFGSSIIQRELSPKENIIAKKGRDDLNNKRGTNNNNNNNNVDKLGKDKSKSKRAGLGKRRNILRPTGAKNSNINNTIYVIMIFALIILFGFILYIQISSNEHSVTKDLFDAIKEGIDENIEEGNQFIRPD